jgi:hypothetical protein
MPISFPTGPATNDTYTYEGKVWTWNGSVWQSNSTPMGPTGPTGAAGATGPTGPSVTGPTGPAYVPAITTVTTTYSTQASDANKIIYSTGGSGYTITVTNTLTAGQWIDVVQYGAGQITFAAGSGVTLNSSGGKTKTNAQYSAATIICVASGLYVLAGDIV